jgi:NAD(P)-dependent dehydrogenase (short-subunit alcohol dehydrogenase family)
MADQFPRPTRSLAGRVAIVSGAGAAGDGIGNGRASAILLAEAGAKVVCVDMALALAQRTVELIEQDNHSTAIAVQANVTSEPDAQNVVARTLEAFGRIDILVNVVGVGGAAGTAEDVDMVEWARGMEINVASMVVMAKYCLPVMARNEGQWRGSVVNIASVAGIRGGTPHLLYPTSKGAVVVSLLCSFFLSFFLFFFLLWFLFRGIDD